MRNVTHDTNLSFAVAWERVRRECGKCEGRKSYAGPEDGQGLIATARELHTNPRGRAPSLRKVATALAERNLSRQVGDRIQHLRSRVCWRGSAAPH
jgi:hypothetical protein